MSNGDSSSSSDELAIPALVRFWIILPVYVPSLVCSLFALYHYVCIRALRQALYNHVIIILLVLNFTVQLTSIPWHLSFYRLGYVWLQQPWFCIVWSVVDEGLHVCVTMFFAWATIERHILIFHDRLVATRRKTILFHYLPLVVVFLYCFCYNLSVIVFPPCENSYRYDELVCGMPLCLLETRLLTVWDVVVNHTIPISCIITGSIGLLVRILYRKAQMRQPIRWRNYRKMTIQLLSISIMYLVFHTPHVLLELVHIYGVSEEVGGTVAGIAEFFAYYTNLLLPFLCTGAIPELRNKLKSIVLSCLRRPRTVHPRAVILTPRIPER